MSESTTSERRSGRRRSSRRGSRRRRRRFKKKLRTVAFWAIVGLLVAAVPAFAIKNKASPNPAAGTWSSGNKKLTVENGWLTPLSVTFSGPEGTREGSGQWLSDHSFVVDFGKHDVTYHLKGNLIYTVVNDSESYYQKDGP